MKQAAYSLSCSLMLLAAGCAMLEKGTPSDGKVSAWWAKDPYDSGFPPDASPPADARTTLALKAPGNYLVNAALMVHNPGKAGIFLRPEFSGASLSRCVVKREAACLRSRGGYNLVADILPELKPGGALFVPGGETRQLFLEINTDGLKPENYRDQLNLVAGDGAIAGRATLDLTITNLSLPRGPTMDLLVWDCSLRGLKGKEAVNLAKTLGRAGVNAFHVLENVKIAFDGKGEIVGNPDFADLDRTLNNVQPYAEFILLRGCSFFNQSGKATIPLKAVDGEIAYYSPEWKKALRNYLRALSAHLADKGWNKNRWALYPYDEYQGVYYVEFAQAVKSVDPTIMVFANPCSPVTGGSPGAVVDLADRGLVDIMVPVDTYYRDSEYLKFVPEFRKKPIRQWSYFCPWPQLGLSPLKQYRMIGWKTFAWNIDGGGYWSATGLDGKGWSGDPWDDTDGIYPNETTLYISEGNVVESRRWMGVRAGGRDHALFATAKRLAESLPENHQSKAALLKLLDTDVKTVVANPCPEDMERITNDIIELTANVE